MLDMKRFRDRRSQGIHEGDGDGYAEWARWASLLEGRIDTIEAANRHSSRAIPDEEAFAELVKFAKQRPEDAVHIIFHHMLSKVGWHQLALLGALTSASPVKKEHAGQLYNIVADWLHWYDRNRGE